MCTSLTQALLALREGTVAARVPEGLSHLRGFRAAGGGGGGAPAHHARRDHHRLAHIRRLSFETTSHEHFQTNTDRRVSRRRAARNGARGHDTSLERRSLERGVSTCTRTVM